MTARQHGMLLKLDDAGEPLPVQVKMYFSHAVARQIRERASREHRHLNDFVRHCVLTELEREGAR